MKARLPSLDVLEAERARAVHAAAHAERQVEAARALLERMARGRNEIVSRAARKVLRTIAEVA